MLHKAVHQLCIKVGPIPLVLVWGDWDNGERVVLLSAFTDTELNLIMSIYGFTSLFLYEK